jgi:hypothetical protein
VDISQTVSTLADATTIPLAAIVQSPRGPIVYVLDEGKAKLQPVKVVYSEGSEAAVTGIQPGDIIVMDGKQNVRPGSPLMERAKEPKTGASGPAPADTNKSATSQAAGSAKP